MVVLIPLLFFILIEFGLRIFNFGYSTDLFEIKKLNDGRDYVYVNRDAVRRFFSSGIRVNMAFERFPLKKEKNTVRIFCFGGSSLKGFPYLKNLSIPGLTSSLLNNIQTNKKFEIINLGQTAIDSTIVAALVDEAGGYDADYYMIFTGHNEFYGAMGYVSKTGLVDSMLVSLRRLRLFQLIESFFTKKSKPFSGTMVSKMIEGKYVENTASMKSAVLKKFKRNINSIIKTAKSRKIKTILFTLPSNIRDCEPFRSKQNRMYYFSKFKLSKNKSIISQTAKIDKNKLKKLLKENGDDAFLHYILGCLEYKKGRTSKALHHFTRARDLDKLKIRAPSWLNTYLRSIRNDVEYFYDFDRAVKVKSKMGIQGNEFFTEYLHPNHSANIMASLSIAKYLYNGFEKIIIKRKHFAFSDIDLLYTALYLQRFYKHFPCNLNNYKNLQLSGEFFNQRASSIRLKPKYRKLKNIFEIVKNLSDKYGGKNVLLLVHLMAANYYYKTKHLEKSLKELEIIRFIYREHMETLKKIRFLYRKSALYYKEDMIIKEMRKISE